MKTTSCFTPLIVLFQLSNVGVAQEASHSLPYAIVDTGQVRCYDDRTEVAFPSAGQKCFGQDAHYRGNQPAYQDNGDGTISDLVTGLMWQADPGSKKTYQQAADGAARCRTGGFKDWRLPSIKELYSLIQFTGTDPDVNSSNSSQLRPFIDSKYFKFTYGKASDGERIIDSQWATSTLYEGTVMGGQTAMFGVNFADGRIKGYPVGRGPGGRDKQYYVIYVRNNPAYGQNDFVDNGDGTITDRATGLTWMKVDSGALKAGKQGDGNLNWPEALAWAEGLDYAGHDDWRLPNAKELQSLVDYARSPDTTNSAAIDPIFECTPIQNEGDQPDFGCYWSGTTHTRVTSADAAVYVAFGRGLGFMSTRGSWSSNKKLMDVHGAGCQRCDPKTGDPSQLSQGRGPQGDVVRIYNLVRCVRGGTAEPQTTGPAVEMKSQGHRFGPMPAGNLPNGRPSAAQWIQRLDRDGDGKVSREEFDGPGNHFDEFDKDGDGSLSADEAPSGPPMGRR